MLNGKRSSLNRQHCLSALKTASARR